MNINNITLSPTGENLELSEVMIYQQLINEGYIFPIAEIKLKSKDIQKLKDRLKIYDFRIFDYSSKTNNFQIWKCEEFYVSVLWNKEDLYITSYCKSEEISVELYKHILTFEINSNDVSLYIDSYYLNPKGQLDSNTKSYTIDDYNYANEAYYPYIKTDVMFDQLFGNKENILILCGKPGVGKTSLTAQLFKYILNTPKYIINTNIQDEGFVQVAYVKSTDVMAEDEFWRSLSAKEYDIVLFDDLDYFLTSREQDVQTQSDVERNKFLSQFLSFTDGIEKNKTNFVITTNQPFDDIDSALLRKGRLFDILELRELNNEEAAEIWIKQGLDLDLFNDIFSTNKVLQADLGSEIEKRLNKDVKIEKYLLDDDISKIYKPIKKLGF